ncbi:hypothetical protein B0H19DRAFT_600469 [Mycena capillaripes]|nr:hypothetical protein B0H19DRAFT_600469 [Mycena capillaripes]
MVMLHFCPISVVMFAALLPSHRLYFGEGATGITLNSLAGSQVIKLFRDRDLAFHEANVLRRARGIPNIPSFHGVVSNGDRIGVVLSYEGTAIRNLASLTLEHKRQLLETLHSLHDRGIHHHDVREQNIVVDHRGAISLIDFDCATLDGHCVSCSDIGFLENLRSELASPPLTGYT